MIHSRAVENEDNIFMFVRKKKQERCRIHCEKENFKF